MVIDWCWYRQLFLNIMDTEALQDSSSSIVGRWAGEPATRLVRMEAAALGGARAAAV
jgi:hypothetical protein